MKKMLLSLLFFFISIIAFSQSFPFTYYVGFDNADLYVHGSPPPVKVSYLTSWFKIDTVNYHHNIWQIGHPKKTTFSSAHSIPNVIVTDTAHSCSANDTSVLYFKIPKRAPLYLLEFSFYYQLDIDTGDIAKMEVSIDSGMVWDDVLHDTASAIYFFGSTTPDFSVSTKGWDSLAFTPASGYFSLYYPLDSILFRFTFISGNSTRPRDGWMMDDFKLAYSWEDVKNINNNNAFYIYPNPADKAFNIQFTATLRSCSLMIQDIYGRCVYKKDMGVISPGSISIPTDGIPSGAYIYSIASVNDISRGTLIIRH